MPEGQITQTKGPGLLVGNRMPTPSAGWTGTIVRLIFGVIFGIDAYLKWLRSRR